MIDWSQFSIQKATVKRRETVNVDDIMNKDWMIQELTKGNIRISYYGEYSDTIVQTVMNELDLNKHEGIVIRLESGYNYEDFGTSLCKLVRPNHVQEYTDPVTGEPKHWKHMQIKPNKLRNSNENNNT